MNDAIPAEMDYSLFGADHVAKYRETGGEIGYIWNGATTLILTTTGRKSGELRDNPMICAADGDNFVVVASQAGAPTHPMWYLNLLANPQVRVQVQADVFDATARTAEGEERERLWSLVNEGWPNFEVYQSRTDRVLPVVVLERNAT
jgi:deazaflavin-dependent oxidoreductase (nitroreductase family)